MVLGRPVNLTLVVLTVVVASVLTVIALTVRDHASGEAPWQTGVWGVATLAFMLLSCGLWAFSLLTAGFACEPCSDDPLPQGLEWTQNPEASEWGLIALFGSGIMVLALATVVALRFRYHRASLLLLLTHVALSVQLVAMLNLAHAGENYWNWTIWPTAAGAVMLLAARDRARAAPSVNGQASHR
jgi:hypothetical protein